MSAIIYRITNTVNGKCYIRQTSKGLEHRWKSHRKDACRGSLYAIHHAIRKYGPDAFDIDVLEETTTDQLNDRERYWVAELRPSYNMTAGGDGVRGHTHTAETRAKMSAMRTGKKNHFYGKRHSAETRVKISATKRSQPPQVITPEHLAKLRAWQASLAKSRRGKPLSVETRAKLSERLRGRRLSAETRAKMSAAAKARWQRR
jgi:group I intron endonuclease